MLNNKNKFYAYIALIKLILFIILPRNTVVSQESISRQHIFPWKYFWHVVEKTLTAATICQINGIPQLFCYSISYAYLGLPDKCERVFQQTPQWKQCDPWARGFGLTHSSVTYPLSIGLPNACKIKTDELHQIHCN